MPASFRHARRYLLFSLPYSVPCCSVPSCFGQGGWGSLKSKLELHDGDVIECSCCCVCDRVADG